MVTEDDVREALRDVYDPEVSVNVQDLGLIYEVRVDGYCLMDDIRNYLDYEAKGLHGNDG
jgi:metal-sulfur cluster biosynthetic enzyme